MHHLLQQNQLHLSQAYETPFASGPLKEHIGEFGTSNGAQQILDGNFDATNFDNLPAVNYWIKHHIQRKAASSTINVSLTIEEYKALFTAQDESTTSSPSGRHYGHYKAATRNDELCHVH
eukprot:4455565-Ditylum_brightwellii.AAC.1